MVECSTGDLVRLHLDAAEGDPGPGGEAPFARSIPGIAAALGIGAGEVADRIALLSAVRSLESEGHLVEEVRRVEGLPGKRNVYRLTDDGRARARDLRERLADERVVVEAPGGREEVRLADVGAHLDRPGAPTGDATGNRGTTTGEATGRPGATTAEGADPPGDRGATSPAGPSAGGKVGSGGDALVWALARVDDDGVIRAAEGEVGEPFADRTEELARLEALVDDAVAGRARTALVVGESGVGKTSLVERVEPHARDRGCAFGLANAGDDAEPYAPIRSALAAASDPAAVATPFERLAGLEVDDPEELSALRSALFHEVAALVRDVAAERPVVVGVDDLQGADRATLALFSYLAEELAAVPALLVGIYDDEAVATDDPLARTLGEVEASRIAVDRLDRAAVADHVRWLLSDPDPPEEFVDLVFERTGGSPLFVEATVRHARETGAVDPEYGVYPDSLAEVDLPGRVRDAVERRVADLPDRARRVLEVGAVVGKTVPFDVLAGAADVPEADLREAADLLVAAHLFEPDGGTDGYRFVGGATRATVLEGIDDDRRRRLHGRVGDAIDAASDGDDRDGGDAGDRKGEAAVAAHYERAGRRGEAIERYRRAGERARAVYAGEDAVAAFESAAALARETGDDGALLAVLEELGDTRVVTGEYDEALRHFAYVRERADDAARRRAFRKASDVHNSAGDYGAAVEKAERGLELGDGPDAETVLLLANEGSALLEGGDPEAARDAFERARDLAEGMDDPELLGKAYNRLGTAELYLGEADAAIGDFERAVEAYETGGAPGSRSTPLTNLGIVYRDLGEFERALECFEEARELLAGGSDPSTEASVVHNLGQTFEALGDHDAALECYEEALELAERIDSRRQIALVAGDVGATYQNFGEFERAREHLERALAVAEGIGRPETVAGVRNTLANLFAQTGDAERAREEAEAALQVARGADNPQQIAYALATVGERDREDGATERAVERHRKGLETAREIGAFEIALLNRIGLARDHLTAGDVERALEHAETARESLDDSPASSLRTAADRVIAECLRERGDGAGAHERLRAALDALEERERPIRAQLLTDLAGIAAERGDEGRAHEFAREGLDLAAEMGLDPVRDRCEELLGDGDVNGAKDGDMGGDGRDG